MQKLLGKQQFIVSGRIVRDHLRRYRKQMIILSILGLVSALGNGIVPYMGGLLIDAILSPGTTIIFDISIQLAFLYLILWGVIQLTTYLVDWQMGTRSDRLGNTIFMDYISNGFGHLFDLPMAFHKRHKVGEIGEKINRTAHYLETIIVRVGISLAPQFLSIIIALVITFLLQPVLAGILVFGVLTYGFTLSKSIEPLAGLQRKMHKMWGKAFGSAYDAIFNVKEIKQAATEDYEKRRLRLFFHKKARPIEDKINNIWQTLTLYQRVTILTTQAIIYIISIYLIINGQMTVGELVTFNGYAAMLFAPFVVLGQQWQTVQNGLIDLEATQRFFDRPTEKYHPDHSHSKPLIGKIEFKNVDFYYNKEKPVLKNVTFTAHPGEVIALVGESGVGKSTLIDLISGFHFPKKGKVLIDGVDIKKFDLTGLRRKISVVPQEVVLFNNTILHNIKYGSFSASMERVKEAAHQANALDYIEKFPKKWKQIVGERGVKLSGGQKQRVAIARAILQDPRILVLDEPTSALDARAEKKIAEALDHLMEGRTTFIIAHRLSTVRKANKILVLKEGEIIESGTHEQLLSIEGGEYRQLHELQIGSTS